MAGTFTQKRDLPLKWAAATYVNQYGNLASQGQFSFPVPKQSTTSFRSGGRFGASGPDTPFKLFQEQKRRYHMPYDIGHAFRSEKQIATTSHKEIFATSQLYPKAFYRGPLWVPASDTSGQTGFIVPPEIALEVYGTKAIASVRPNKPAVSLSRGLAEIFREGFPKLIGGVTYSAAVKKRDRLSSIEDAGGEFLNGVFGLVPTIQLIKDLAEATLHAYPILTQYLRDSGRVVRKQMSFDPIITTSTRSVPKTFLGSVPPNVLGGWSTEFSQRTGSWECDVSLRRDIWFSGAFQYFITKSGKDPFDELERYRQLSRRLLDTEITIDTIYALTPWSWLVDWFVDFGDILGNVIAFQNDGLVLRYGYLMCQSIQDNTGRVADVTLGGHNYGSVATTYRTIRKERVKATPFGFGLNPNTFSAGQWAILAALGLTTGPNLLR